MTQQDMTQQDMPKQDEPKPRTVWEEFEVAGDDLVARVKELAQEASVRQLKIIADDGDVFLQTPLNIGLVAGGVVVLAAPWLAILGALAAMVARVRIVVERDVVESEGASAVAGERSAGSAEAEGSQPTPPPL